MIFVDRQSWKEDAPAWPWTAWNFSDYEETGAFQVLSQPLASLTVAIALLNVASLLCGY